MILENEFTVKVPIETAWEVLTDIPGIAPCLPGARLTGQDGDVYSGKMKIKVGPVTAEYAGTADFIELDKENRHVKIDAKGRDSRGSGNANAMITADMTAEGDYTKVVINTDLKIAGKVAQFGKGVIGDVSKKLIDQFVECIEDKIAHLDDEGSAADVAAASAAATSASAATAPLKRTFDEPDEEHEALDLMDAAGGAMVKRLAPIGAGAALIALIIWIITRG
ncbi:MAG: SRPBCC family protein [Acidimicrobiales bacterium]|nr:SRPBCC family protein [Acidimicrobiales bacterium]